MVEVNTTALSPVIVTGGCGFIGYHIIAQIVKDEPDCKIHVIDINTNRNRIAAPGIEYYTCDITSLSNVEQDEGRGAKKVL